MYEEIGRDKFHNIYSVILTASYKVADSKNIHTVFAVIKIAIR